MSVRHAILALLSEGPKYGLQLQKEFESSTGQVWPLNIGGSSDLKGVGHPRIGAATRAI